MLVPAFLLPARLVGRRLAEITRESYQLDATMSATMTERFGVAGALLVKLFGRPEAEAERFAERAARVRDIGVQQAMYGTHVLRRHDAGRVAGAGPDVRASAAGSRCTGTIQAGTVVSLALLLTRLYGPITSLSNVRVNIMSALVSFERVFEVLDLRAGDRRAARRRRRSRGHGQGRVPRREVPLPVRGRGVAGLAGGRGGA